MLMVICVIACGRRLKSAIFQRLHEGIAYDLVRSILVQ
jgi:hypothetical protein